MRNAVTYNRDERKFALLLFLFLSFSLSTQAQQFSVKSFRTIPNDLTAFHSPVYDLNHDACALIKVVGDARFVFDSPLGIVKRTDEVGEVWIYLPQGSVMLTIRHPEWGVLRDYRLAEPLVANITYELVLAPPVQAVTPTIVEVEELKIEKVEEKEPVTEHVPTLDVVEKVTVKEKLQIMALTQVGIGPKSMAYGLRIGLLQKHGVYLMAETDFKSAPSTAGECDADGVVKGTSSAAYYSGEIKRSLKRVMVGGMHSLVGGLHWISTSVPSFSYAIAPVTLSPVFTIFLIGVWKKNCTPAFSKLIRIRSSASAIAWPFPRPSRK